MSQQRWEYCLYAGLYSHSTEDDGINEDSAVGETLLYFYSEGKEYDFGGPAATFKALGEAGWELVSSIVLNYQNELDPTEQLVKHLFKRPIED